MALAPPSALGMRWAAGPAATAVRTLEVGPCLSRERHGGPIQMRQGTPSALAPPVGGSSSGSDSELQANLRVNLCGPRGGGRDGCSVERKGPCSLSESPSSRRPM
jgi:hypothetical protein